MKIKNAFYAFVTTSDILVGAIFTEEIPVLHLFSTLFLVIDVLKGSYKEKLSAEMLKANFSSVSMVLFALTHSPDA